MNTFVYILHVTLLQRGVGHAWVIIKIKSCFRSVISCPCLSVRYLSPEMSRNPKGPPKGTHSILEGIDLRKPECKGYLFKQSKTHRAYNQRYFALYKKLLVYYETEDEFVHDVGLNTLQVRAAVSRTRVIGVSIHRWLV